MEHGAMQVRINKQCIFAGSCHKNGEIGGNGRFAIIWH